MNLAANIVENVDNIFAEMKENDCLCNVEWDISNLDENTIKLDMYSLDKGGQVNSLYNKEDLFHAAVIVGNKNGLISTSIANIIVGKTLFNLINSCQSNKIK